MSAGGTTKNSFKLGELLTDDGVALVHSVGYSDAPAPINPFIRKYIFPGADLPSLSEAFAAAERSGLVVTDVEILRLSRNVAPLSRAFHGAPGRGRSAL